MKRGPTIPKREEAKAAAIDADAQSAVEAVRGAPKLPRSNQVRPRRK
jgi:hypothetical protein